VYRSESGALIIDQKLRSGMEHYARRWPGEVTLAAAAATSAPGATLGATTTIEDELPFGLCLRSDWATAVRDSRPDVLVAPLISRAVELAEHLTSTIFSAEFTPEDLRDHELSSTRSLMGRTRVRVGSRRRMRQFEKLAQLARGVQCNGYAAYERVGRLSHRPMLYFDTRLTADHVARARATPREIPEKGPRLGFSGRLVRAKGPEFALAVTETLQREGLDPHLDVFGLGEMRTIFREDASHVDLHGSVPFDPDWTSFVTQHLDLMILPHVQGDPSGTYLESAGCGVPVLGFANVALGPLVKRHRIGWTTPVRDAAALARQAYQVLTHPDEWRAARAAGLDFMEEHHVDAEFDRRVAHLLAV